MIKTILKTTLFFALTAFLYTSCTKDKSCFDQRLYNQHKDDICTTDCPGVIGCDGKTYCNECDALRNGIVVE